MTAAPDPRADGGRAPGWRGRADAARDRIGSRTLAGRLAIGGIAWISVWAVALLLVFNVLLSSVLGGQLDAALRARSQAVAATVSYRGGQLVILPGEDDALDAGTSLYLGQDLVEGNDLSPALRQGLLQHGEQAADREIFGPVRYLAVPIESAGRQVGTIVVSSDTGERGRTAWVIGVASIGFVGMLLLFTFFALRGLIRRAMRPVGVMGDQAASWSDKDIDRRFDPEAGPLELRHLAVTLNSLLERISATVRHERRLTAELSHEMRTPLAHLHAEVELLAAAGGDDGDDPRSASAAAGPGTAPGLEAGALDRLLTSIRRLEGLVETALAPARVQQEGAPGLARITDVLAHLPGSSSSEAVLSVLGRTDLLLSVDADVARRALAPVLENAWRYAVDEIRIDAGLNGGQVRIEVTDDGGRLDPEQTGAIFDPGFRADRADGHPGAGLGLALTRRICRATGGDATATVADGRTTITLYFPGFGAGIPS